MRPVVPGLVSVCIPSRNRRDLVLRAVQSSLRQTYSRVEVIVSDNASEDGSADAIEEIAEPRLHLIRQKENIGLVANLNAVLQFARGEYFILLSDDDVLEADAIEQLIAPLLHGLDGISAEKIGLTWCPCSVIDAAGESVYTTTSGPRCERSPDFMHGLYAGTRGPRLSSVLTRTQDAWQAGSYNESRHGALCDTGNWGAVALRYPNVVCIPRPLVKYTVLAISETSQGQYSDWQVWGHAMLDDHIASLNAQGDSHGARKLESARSTLLANLTASLLMRRVGKPGWLREWIAEGWRSRRFMLSRYTANRLLRDGWKLLRG